MSQTVNLRVTDDTLGTMEETTNCFGSNWSVHCQCTTNGTTGMLPKCIGWKIQSHGLDPMQLEPNPTCGLHCMKWPKTSIYRHYLDKLLCIHYSGNPFLVAEAELAWIWDGMCMLARSSFYRH